MNDGKFSRLNIQDKLSGNNKLGSVLGSQVRNRLGASSTLAVKSKLAKELAGRSALQRKAVYQDLEINKSGMKKVEGAIIGKGELTSKEKELLAKKADMTRRRNIFSSVRSAREAESSSGFGVKNVSGPRPRNASDSGRTSYEKYSFAAGGGEIRVKEETEDTNTRSNTGFVSHPTGAGGNPYPKGKSLGGGGISKPGAGSGRPLGF